MHGVSTLPQSVSHVGGEWGLACRMCMVFLLCLVVSVSHVGGEWGLACYFAIICQPCWWGVGVSL